MFTPTIDSVIKGVVPGPKILDLKYKQKISEQSSRFRGFS